MRSVVVRETPPRTGTGADFPATTAPPTPPASGWYPSPKGERKARKLKQAGILPTLPP